MAGAVDDKATRRNNGNVRFELPKAKPATGPRPASTGKPSGMRRATMGDAVAAVFPQTTRNWRSSDADAGAAYAKGETGRALGASARKILTVPAGLAYDLVKPLVVESDAERAFGEGIIGGFLSSDGSTKVNKAFTPPAATGKEVVSSALAAGKTAQSPLTPQEMMQAALLDRVSGPMTRGDMTRFNALLPAPTKPVSAKDTQLDTTASIADSLYANTLAQIAAAKKAGTLSEEEFQEQNTKAGEKYFDMRANLLGANLLNFRQANMMPDPDEEAD